MKGFIEVTLFDGKEEQKAIIPTNTIYYITQEEGFTKIYFSKGNVEYVTARQDVDQLAEAIGWATE